MSTPARLLLHRLTLGLAGILASTALIALYARGHGSGLGFVLLLPWLLSLQARASWRLTLLSALAMSVGYTLAALGWFADAIAAYTGVPAELALLVLIVAAPLLQPQFLAFALVRRALATRLAWLPLALTASAAYVACEWLMPKLLGDTLGHGLIEAQSLRQAADLGGAALLSFLLVLSALALAELGARLRSTRSGLMVPIALAAGIPLLMFGYGQLRIAQLAGTMSEPVPAVRVGMIQSGISDYAALREELGSHEAVRQILDRHFQLSQTAIEQHGAEALLWSETVYPTPYGHPKSEDGAVFDAAIREFVEQRGRPLLFGTYDVDGAGEYNAAALLDPAEGLLARYRKTHPFPLTEHVPDWLDGPRFRAWAPWAGSWQRGDGARVLPLRTADGRSLEVQPLICLDAVRPELALQGTRLGAQALVVLSNDAWFSATPLGARLHLSVSRFRSIETRLPQLRVTPNGLTAFIDPSGEVLAEAPPGEAAVLGGPVPVRTPPPTLMVAWGDWFGAAAAVWALLAIGFAFRPKPKATPLHDPGAVDPNRYTAQVIALDPRMRGLITALRVLAALGLSWLLLRMFTVDGFQVNRIIQLQIYGGLVLFPLLLAWLLGVVSRATLRVEGDQLLLLQRGRRIEIPWRNIVAIECWRLPLPAAGAELRLSSGRRAPVGLAEVDVRELRRLLQSMGQPTRDPADVHLPGEDYHADRLAARHRWLDHGAIRFGLFPMLLAIPAFRLHQLIAFGGSFGEYLSFGALAYLKGFLIWWGAWSLGTMLTAAALRILIESVLLAGHRLAPKATSGWRSPLEWTGRIAFYGLIPAWLFWRVLMS